MATSKTIAICDLVEDMEIYPRHAVDDANVASLVRALEAGLPLPPLVVDRKSKRIVDGWHRYRAYKRFVGPEAVVDVDLRTYKDEASMMIDAVSLNATHGRKLDAIDHARIVVMLKRVNVDPVRIAVALQVPEARVVQLECRLASATHERRGTVTGGTEVALKRPVTWMAGQTLTDEQVEVHNSLPGTSFLLIANQLRTALDAKMVNLTDEKLVEALKKLQKSLAKVLD